MTKNMGYKFNSKTKTYEHRDLYEQYYGVKLTSGQIIHHRNGILTDNSKENLMLFPNTQSHILFHHYKNKNGKLNEEAFLNNIYYPKYGR